MNREQYFKYRKNMQKLTSHLANRNKVSINLNESREHLFKKVEVCRQLRELGFEFITEACFKKYGRADIYVPEADVVIEILHTEEILYAKKINYPVERIIIVKTYEETDISKIL